MNAWRAAAIGLLLGCPMPGAVGIRPDGSPGPEPCPRKALEAMALLRLHPGDSAWIHIDMNQRGDRSIVVNDGPVEGGLQEPLGWLEAGTRLYGHIWTGGSNVVIRYYEAHPPDPGGTIPICAVARLGDGQLRKKPGPAPGSALLDYSTASLHIVDGFR